MTAETKIHPDQPDWCTDAQWQEVMRRSRRYLDAMIEARHIDPDDEASPIEREAWDDARRN